MTFGVNSLSDRIHVLSRRSVYLPWCCCVKTARIFFLLMVLLFLDFLHAACCVISLTRAGRLRNAHSSPRAWSWKPPNRDRYLFCCGGLLLWRTNFVICGCFQRVSFLDGHIHLSPIVFPESVGNEFTPAANIRIQVVSVECLAPPYRRWLCALVNPQKPMLHTQGWIPALITLYYVMYENPQWRWSSCKCQLTGYIFARVKSFLPHCESGRLNSGHQAWQ